MTVQTIGMPPAESRQETLRYVSDASEMSGGPKYSESDFEIKRMEVENDEIMFAILSDVHLDHPLIFEKLETLFQGLF